MKWMFAASVVASLMGRGALGQAPDGVWEVGGMVMLARDEGLFAGVPYGQSTTLVGGAAGVRIGPVFGHVTGLRGTLPAGKGLAERSLTDMEFRGGVLAMHLISAEVSLWLREYDGVESVQRWAGILVGAGVQGALVPGLFYVRAALRFGPRVASSIPALSLNQSWQGETEISCQPDRIPIRIALGYRMDRLDVNEAGGALWNMRLSGLTARLQFRW